MPSSTVENYLKQLFIEQQQTPGQLVPMGRLASQLNVAPGTVTSMVKALADSELVEYEPRTGAKLTRSGELLALRVLRRHRLVELFLVEILGLDWSEVHEEAEELEHAISDKVLDRIDALLGQPATDPHGDPIPTSRGKLASPRLDSLADCPTGQSVRVSRMLDQNPPFLQFARQQGLRPGADLVVEKRDPQADALTLRAADGSAITVGSAAAAKILVVKRD